MANENVKIVIQEINETLPKGSGASSDIAYIPGLAVEKYATAYDTKGNAIKFKEDWAPLKNVPQLCNTVAEFESYFGPDPYEMSAKDVAILTSKYPHLKTMYGAKGNGSNINSKDLSYIYAKELLNAGMSVIYENVAPEYSSDSLLEVAVPEAVQLSSKERLKDLGKGEFSIAIPALTEGEAPATGVYSLRFKLPQYPEAKLNAAGEVIESAENDTASGSVSIRLDIAEEFSNVVTLQYEIKCSESFTDPTQSGFHLNDNTISWKDVYPDAFEYTYFTIELKIGYNNATEEQIDVPFSFTVVEGDSVEGVVEAGSRIDFLYSQLRDRFSVLEDKNEYSVKYLTSGGYPTFNASTNDATLATKMTSVCANRGDAIALIDHEDNPAAPLTGTGSVYKTLNTSSLASDPNGTFGAIYTPYGYYNLPATGAACYMPASFAYLMCMAAAIKTSPNWLAMAGVTRGSVPYLQKLNTVQLMSNVIAEDYQPKWGSDGANISMNAITNIRPYGLCVWGNRTLEPVAEKGTTALNFVNTRNMISDIKKLAYSTAKALMFEQESDTLWLRFKSGITPFLNQLKSGAGISNFKLIRGTTKYDGSPLTRGEMAAVIKIYPRYAVEYFEITVVVADEDVSVS